MTGVSYLLFTGFILLLLGGCMSSEKQRENALRCSDAMERLDQVKRLRDNGFVSESAVRAMEGKRNEACTW